MGEMSDEERLTDYFMREIPSVIVGGVKVTAEDAMLLAQDQALFGCGYIKAEPGGVGRRVAPEDVSAGPQEPR